ncbi:MAG: hypothetical protein LUG24_05960 [Clostridiales bacterium]|nr:hypothetical protein [Clostridiales bacterium]
MKRKLSLIFSVIFAAAAMTGCGGGYKYTSEDGSFSITLPGEQWQEESESLGINGGYMFTLPATSDSAVETQLDSDAIIVYLDLSAEEGSLDYDSIPTTEEELTDYLGLDGSYEVLSFEGDLDDDGVKSNTYKLKISGSENSEMYMVTKTEASETEGYIIAGTVLHGGEELIDEVEKSVLSVSRK